MGVNLAQRGIGGFLTDSASSCHRCNAEWQKGHGCWLECRCTPCAKGNVTRETGAIVG